MGYLLFMLVGIALAALVVVAFCVGLHMGMKATVKLIKEKCTPEEYAAVKARMKGTDEESFRLCTLASGGTI